MQFMGQSMNKDIDFLYEVGALRRLGRAWNQFLNPDAQNITEHTFRVIFLALILARLEKVNPVRKSGRTVSNGASSDEKILKFALIHDLPESRTNDFHAGMKLYSSRDEERAARDLFANTSLGSEFEKLFTEYQKRDSIEAKIVKDADTLDIDLELQEQEARGNNLKKYCPDRQMFYKKLYTKSARKMFREIQKSEPHKWHMELRNRYNRTQEN